MLVIIAIISAVIASALTAGHYEIKVKRLNTQLWLARAARRLAE